MREKKTNKKLVFATNRDAMVDHPEFVNAGKKEGLQVWRMEDLELAPVPESLHGGFYMGDAYLVLRTQVNRGGGFQYDLHYWLGTRNQLTCGNSL